MTKISSPYNFVPLNRYVYIPEWWDKVSNDIPFRDSEDGSIEFTFTNVSPIFTRNGSASKDERYSAHVKMPDRKRLYFLPGSSIKGMLRSSLEVMSFGKMMQYDDRSFGYRTFNEKEDDYDTYHNTIKNQQCGWLEKKGDSYFLIPCKGDFISIELSEIPYSYKSRLKKRVKVKGIKKEVDIIGVGERNIAIGNYPSISWNGNEYKLVCTGYIKTKKHEYLFPVATDESISLMEIKEGKEEKKKVLRQFLSIYAQNKDATDFINDFLEKGKRIHVFYVSDSNGNIIAMGLSRMMKLPYGNSISDLVNNGQETKEARDLCETMFGYVEVSDNDLSVKGRVQICNAYCIDEEGKELTIADNELLKFSGVLGEPKPSFYPFYIKQSEGYGNYMTYADAETIAGRKFYRIHEGSNVASLPRGNNNENMLASFNAIPQNHIFKCRINVHNLKPIEVGALLYSIIQEDGVYHNLGMAKSFGFGKLKCCEKKNIELIGLSKSIDGFIKCFTDEINRWGQKVFNNTTWSVNDSVEVTTLKAIRKEHTDAEVRMLEMRRSTGKQKRNKDGSWKDVYENEFVNIKKEFQILKEKNVKSSAKVNGLPVDKNPDANFEVVKATVVKLFLDGAMVSLDGFSQQYLPVNGVKLRPGEKILVKKIKKGSNSIEFYKKG